MIHISLPRFQSLQLSYLDQREDLNDEVAAFINKNTPGSTQGHHAAKPHKGIMSITSKIITVTPADAMKFLANMVHNRPLSQHNVKLYVEEILSGRWGLTGQGIIFDEKGRLLDGQHRMHAVIKAGKSIQTTAVYGVNHDMFTLLDGGNKRTVSDVINVKNRAVVAGAAKYIYRELNRVKWSTSAVRPRPIEGAKIVKNYPALERSAEIAVSMRKSVSFIPPAPLAYCHFMANRENPAACETFFYGLSTGANLGERSPILALRKALTPAQGSYTNDVTAITMFIVAWNLYLNKSSAKTLKVPAEAPLWTKALV